jgi:N-methylhydantoinase A/oxoprolinase/acetone carboxylase beta subunit
LLWLLSSVSIFIILFFTCFAGTPHRPDNDSYFRLASFGGAGGQHACEIAQLLGIKTILIHRYSSILSVYGLALADQ